MKLTKDLSHLVDIAVNIGKFDFHHAKNDYVMLTRWINEDEASKLPLYASHYVGVGGLVLNSTKDKILSI
jgi:hypothetical protein